MRRRREERGKGGRREEGGGNKGEGRRREGGGREEGEKEEGLFKHYHLWEVTRHVQPIFPNLSKLLNLPLVHASSLFYSTMSR
jgi:hypothetical protein